MIEKGSMNITEDEAALYDRQIRLWGLDAQKRLRAARVLLVGVSGLGAEISKNIILSGIKSITLLDHSPVSEEDACSQFLVDRKDVGKNRAESSLVKAQQLNPMVEVTADSQNVEKKADEFFTNFDIVCVTCSSLQQMTRINEICHKNNIQFYAGDVFGFYGFMFADLNVHEYAEEVPQKKKKQQKQVEEGSGEPAPKKVKVDEPETITVKKQITYTRLQNAISVDWSLPANAKLIKKTPIAFFITQVLLKFRDQHKRDPSIGSHSEDVEELKKIREEYLAKTKLPETVIPEDFVRHCSAELSPVCAVVGGVLGQEIIKAVSKKDTPHNNFFFFDGVEGSGMVDSIGY